MQKCKELKRAPGEDIVNYKTRVKCYREAAGYDNLNSEQYRIFFIILTAGNTKYTDECLQQVTGHMERLNSAFLQIALTLTTIKYVN